jgi:hypothetical protein
LLVLFFEFHVQVFDAQHVLSPWWHCGAPVFNGLICFLFGHSGAHLRKRKFLFTW